MQEPRLTEFFLHPPFDAPELRAILLGPAARSLAMRPGVADGWAVRADADALRVALVKRARSRVAGILVEPKPDPQERLFFAFAAMGAVVAGLDIEADCEIDTAWGFAFRGSRRPSHRWPGSPSPREREARFAEALTEIMGHYGHRPAEEVAGLLHGIGIRALARTRGATRPSLVTLGRGFTSADVEPMEREFSYARFFGMEEHRLRHRRFDGTMSEAIDRAVFTSGDAITVLPFDPRTGSVLLIEQFRAGPWARRDPRPWSLETVAGRCDETEPPEATARREAREEAGLELGRLERIAAFYPSPGIVAEHITSFVAEADLGGAGGTHGLAEEHEDIRVVVVPLDDALAAIATGEINTSPLMLSLLWLSLHAERLRAAWR